MRTQGVLIVEDDESTRAVLADLLQEEGYMVFTAPDGQPALERLRTHPAGLVVLCDLWMPGMDGYALLQAIAAEAPLTAQHAYILMTATAKTLPLKVVDLLKHLNVTTIPKPFDIDDVLAEVKRAASRLV
ncbi:MAG TPA: response regulator [Ktedonobacterales bacterium]|nr:response regulator [Ktedonobacterales bacterium]